MALCNFPFSSLAVLLIGFLVEIYKKFLFRLRFFKFASLNFVLICISICLLCVLRDAKCFDLSSLDICHLTQRLEERFYAQVNLTMIG